MIASVLEVNKADSDQSSGICQEQSLSGIMGEDSLIPVATNASSRNDLVERGFSRQPLRVDVDVARSLEELSHAAWSIPKDKYYEGGDRYRSLNRARAEIVEGGVKVWVSSGCGKRAYVAASTVIAAGNDRSRWPDVKEISTPTETRWHSIWCQRAGNP